MIRGGGGMFFLKKSWFGKSQEKIFCLVMQGNQVCSCGKTHSPPPPHVSSGPPFTDR